MISSAALWFVPLLYTLTTTAAATCNSTIFCPCGSSNYTYKLCIDDMSDKENACDVWSQCETCQDNLPHCVTCPEKKIGSTCSEVNQTRKKRQYPTYPINRRQTINPTFYGPCPRLESPDLGSVSCRQQGNFRSCTGRCLPGYRFEDRRGVPMDEDEITLECRRNTWEPYRTFPPCRTGGYCKIKIEGAGSYNCTTSMDGTRCDIFCDGNYLGRYHCFPGRDWNPDLPYCASVKDSGSAREPSCSCQNSGYCDSNGNCVCPSGWTGANCDRADRVAPVTCPDPGTPRGGDRRNEDGTPASTIRSFPVGEAVVFSCRGSNSALQGSSTIYCRSNGSWSASRPRCIRVQNPSSRRCPDPGVVSNGDRLNTDGSPSTTDQTYTQGQSVVYSCQEGYALYGTSMLTCLRTGQWSSDRPRCSLITVAAPVTNDGPVDDEDDNEITCEEPEADINGYIEDHPLLDPQRGDNVFPPGTQLVFHCREGYQSIGPVILNCFRSGDWSSLPPTCEETFATTESPPGDSRISCKHPGLDPNGDIEDTPLLDPRVRGQRFPPGTELTYTCKEGYELEGMDVIECLRNGDWTDPAPSCIEKNQSINPESEAHCEDPGPVSNGKVEIHTTLDESRRPDDDDSKYPTRTRLLFSCEVGYTLIGRSRLVCGSNGLWNADLPFCVEDCGRALLQTTHKITHGTKTVAGEWPWTVAIAATKGNVTSVICGGALLDTRTVLTAAHCLIGYSVFTLYFGKFHRKDKDDDAEVDKRRSTRIVSHRDFNRITYDNDIALIKFEPNVRYSERIQTICLPTPQSTRRNLIPGNRGYVTGWGITEKNLVSDELLMAHLPIQPTDKCVEAFEDLGLPQTIRPGMFCAGFENGVVSACRGDSGSPFVFYDRRTERHTIEGLVSFGTDGQCGQPKRYTVFTKVSDFMTWMLRNWPR